MFTRLALRNVRRQIRNYLIYFITVSITVALMFAVNNVIFSQQLLEYMAAGSPVRSALIAVTVFAVLVSAFVLGYATAFLLRFRKREFGTYLTMGMTRKNILLLFLLETLFLCVVALIIGILLGLFLYQGLMALVTALLEVEFSFSLCSVKGLLLTAVLSGAVFLLSAAASAGYLGTARIYRLIQGDQYTHHGNIHIRFWSAAAFLSLAALIGGCIGFSVFLDQMYHNTTTPNPVGIIISGIAAAAAIVLLHISLAKSIVGLLLKSSCLRCKGTAVFVLRQLSGQLSANAVMTGFLALLICGTVIGSLSCFIQRINVKAYLETYYPFDMVASNDMPEETASVDYTKLESIVSRYVSIRQRVPYTVYIADSSCLDGAQPTDSTALYFLRQSDYNKLYQLRGAKAIQLADEFLILSRSDMKQDWSGSRLTLGGQCYAYGGTSEQQSFSPLYPPVLIVIPDSAAAKMEAEIQGFVYDLDDQRFDGMALYNQLFDMNIQNLDVSFKESARQLKNSSSASIIASILYLSAVFLFMSMALLALKVLSGLSGDRQKYHLLYRLGIGEREQKRILFQQLFSFFFFPYIIPALMSIPAVQIAQQLISLDGYGADGRTLRQVAILTLFILTVVYLLYFTAAYFIAKKNVICHGEPECMP